MEAKLADAQRRLSTLSARSRAAEIRSKMAVTDVAQLDEHDAFAKFERLSKKVETAEAEAEAMAELARSRKGPSSESAADEAEVSGAQLEIDAELAALKQRKGR